MILKSWERSDLPILAPALQFSPLLSRPGVSFTEIALLLFLIALLVSIGAWFGIQSVLKQSLPKRSGELKVEGLDGVVRVGRDLYGVPVIEAESLRDLLFAQGFVQAQDRLWQMELNRRLGAGRLSELFGEQALPADIFLRRLGLRQAAKSNLDVLDEEERAMLEAFCAGVNEAVRQTKVLPFEFRLLRISPEPWQPLDTLTWVQVMSMDLSSNWEQELLRGRIVEKLGPEGAELLHLFTESASLTLPPAALGEKVLEGLWDLYEQAKAYLPNGGLPGASNAWVVSGQRTFSGRPLLANDPHLVGRVPSIWYESRLICPELDVRGAGFPGVPFIVIGANRRVSWGITNSFADTMDLYLEKLGESDYETPQGRRPLETRVEEIEIKGGATYRETIESTRHGPLLFRTGDQGLALRWKNFEPANPIRTLYAFNKAPSAKAFKEALRDWQAPSSNFVFADVEGNIGYLMAGHVPKRKSGTGLTPVPGWTDEYEWDGQIPFEELPQCDNPESGFLVTANNPVVGADYPYHITWDWMSSTRAARIEQLLLEKEKHDTETFAAMQVDTYSGLGLRFLKVCRELEFRSRAANAGFKILAEWDGNGHSTSEHMALYQVALLKAVQRVTEQTLGEELSRQFLGQSSNPVAVMAGHTGRYTAWLIQLLEQPERYRALQRLAPELPARESLVEDSLGGAYLLLCRAFGTDYRLWEWGKLHRLQFKHPLAVNMVLGWLLNSPTGSAGGDTDTVFQTALNPQKPFGVEAWCPSFRQIVEMTDDQHYSSVIPTGQSGHPGSKNYLDQFHKWCAGELREGRSRVRSELVLRPPTA